MEHIEKMKKEYTEQFNKSNEYRVKLLEEIKKTEVSMEQLRGAFQALEQLSEKLKDPAKEATPALAVVPGPDEAKADSAPAAEPSTAAN